MEGNSVEDRFWIELDGSFVQACVGTHTAPARDQQSLIGWPEWSEDQDSSELSYARRIRSFLSDKKKLTCAI
ncbi:unnamed protein product [Hymenolepis diminuta]|uniref:Alanyl-tRNA synthetase n=1 Tax=Hymenolepis diminuta TaxID=6216 RepID=A0A0R3SM11_HYMDI|nr:unnamed protein product [Hymenolepis diminuta]